MGGESAGETEISEFDCVILVQEDYISTGPTYDKNLGKVVEVRE